MLGSPPTPTPPVSVVVCSHRQRDLSAAAVALARAGHTVETTSSLVATRDRLRQRRPDAVVLDPVALVADGVEIELLQALQREGDPVPVLFLVDDHGAVAAVAAAGLPLRDLLLWPSNAAELQFRFDRLLEQRRTQRRFAERARQLESEIAIDFKTGLLSEKFFWRMVEVEWQRARRNSNALSLMFLDIDNFKRVNDTTEYAFGDVVLRTVGETLRSCVRTTDFAARCGGDEFCLLLPDTSLQASVEIADRIRTQLAGTRIESGRYACNVTVSIGIDTYDGRTPGSAELLRSRANQALKLAKTGPKNQISILGSEPPANPAVP